MIGRISRRRFVATGAGAGALGTGASSPEEPPESTAGTRRGRLKTIGILGGLGPQATLDLEARIHHVAGRLIPPDGNSGYPPMVVFYHRRPPFVMSPDGTGPVIP